jgi:hypothetical protein
MGAGASFFFSFELWKGEGKWLIYFFLNLIFIVEGAMGGGGGGGVNKIFIFYFDLLKGEGVDLFVQNHYGGVGVDRTN